MIVITDVCEKERTLCAIPFGTLDQHFLAFSVVFQPHCNGWLFLTISLKISQIFLFTEDQVNDTCPGSENLIYSSP